MAAIEIENKIVLVTGASAGIGKETAELLLKNGYQVYAAARRLDKMNDLKQQGAKILRLDLTDDASLVEAVETIIKQEGKIDILINNAGYGSYGAIEDVSLADARRQYEVNVFGTARLIQLVLPHMREQRSGRIINVSSVAGKFASALGGWYFSSKFALEGLSDTLRQEVQPFGIDVIVIEPGAIKSEWGGIAIDNLLRVSGKTAYAPLANKLSAMFTKMTPKASEPIVIAKLIKKAIEDKSPNTRYAGGASAKPILFLRKILPDRTMDKIFMSMLK